MQNSHYIDVAENSKRKKSRDEMISELKKETENDTMTFVAENETIIDSEF